MADYERKGIGAGQSHVLYLTIHLVNPSPSLLLANKPGEGSSKLTDLLQSLGGGALKGHRSSSGGM